MMFLDQSRDLFDLAFAEIRCRPNGSKHHDAGLRNIEIDGAGEADCLVKTGRWRPVRRRGPCRRPPHNRLDDKRAPGRRPRRA